MLVFLLLQALLRYRAAQAYYHRNCNNDIIIIIIAILLTMFITEQDIIITERQNITKILSGQRWLLLGLLS